MTFVNADINFVGISRKINAVQCKTQCRNISLITFVVFLLSNFALAWPHHGSTGTFRDPSKTLFTFMLMAIFSVL